MADERPEPPRHTPLHALHEALGARMVTFAGYALPLQYVGIVKEHAHTRTHASLFDVSHMGQLRLTGSDAAAGLETLVPVDVVGLPRGRQRYGFLTNDAGGIHDDLMIAALGDALLLVVNAATKAADVEHLRAGLGRACTLDVLDDRALLALQGPAAADVMRRHAPETASMAFMDVIPARLAGAECWLSRSGYTGEDGFEISVPAAAAERLARDLLESPDVAPAGLGARDSLRLEAGLCLYGHDLDAGTTPVEASLSWAISKARRPAGVRAGGYPGAAVIERELEHGSARRRVALLTQARVPVREGTGLTSADGGPAGIVTSGGFGPTLGAPVAMGYVRAASAAPGTELTAVVRGKPVTVRVAEMPVVPHHYARR